MVELLKGNYLATCYWPSCSKSSRLFLCLDLKSFLNGYLENILIFFAPEIDCIINYRHIHDSILDER